MGDHHPHGNWLQLDQTEPVRGAVRADTGQKKGDGLGATSTWDSTVISIVRSFFELAVIYPDDFSEEKIWQRHQPKRRPGTGAAPQHSGCAQRKHRWLDGGSQSWWSFGQQESGVQHEPCALVKSRWTSKSIQLVNEFFRECKILEILSFWFSLKIHGILSDAIHGTIWCFSTPSRLAAGHHRVGSRRHPVKGWFLESVNGYGEVSSPSILIDSTLGLQFHSAMAHENRCDTNDDLPNLKIDVIF